MVAWPAAFGVPLQAGYGIEYIAAVTRTQFDAGPPRVRRRFTMVPDRHPFQIRMTEAVYTQFATWWRTTARHGSLWVDDMPLWAEGGVQPRPARFATEPRITGAECIRDPGGALVQTVLVDFSMITMATPPPDQIGDYLAPPPSAGPPFLITALPTQALRVGQFVSFDVQPYFVDPEGGALTYAITGLPAGTGLSLIGSVLSGTPNALDASAAPFSAIWTATDPAGQVIDGAQLFTDVDADTAYDAWVNSLAPLGYWKLNETLSNIAYDSSGNGRDGIYFGTPTQGVPGVPNRAVQFSGLPNPGGKYIQVDDAPFSGRAAISIGFWARANGPASFGRDIVRLDSGPGASTLEWMFHYANAPMRWSVYDGPLVGRITDPLASVSDNTWHFFVGTASTSSAQRMYRDGGEVVTSPFGAADIGSPATDTRLRIGIGDAELSMSNVAIWPGILTPAQILQGYNTALAL